MLENKKYTIVVKRSRVEVSEAVYHASYHKEREAEDIKRNLLINLSFPRLSGLRLCER